MYQHVKLIATCSNPHRCAGSELRPSQPDCNSHWQCSLSPASEEAQTRQEEIEARWFHSREPSLHPYLRESLHILPWL